MKTYEDFVLEYTGRDMEYHKRYEIWGHESGRAAWDAAIAAERDMWAIMLGESGPKHLYRGDCPDADQWNARDKACKACKLLGAWKGFEE